MFSQFLDLAKGLNVREIEVFHSHHRPRIKIERGSYMIIDENLSIR
jgi:hypothetical protein